MTTADATAEAGAKKRLNLAPIQKFGRSLMLPIAALPVAALMLRLGQPDLLGADGLGWDKVAAVAGRRWRSPVREPAAALRRRCRHRHGEEGRRLDGAGRGGRLPRLQGRGGCRVAVRAPVTSAGRGPGADQLRRARRHPVRADRRATSGSATTASRCRPTWRSSVAGASCRSSPGSRRSSWPCCWRVIYPAFDAGLTNIGEWVAANADHRRRSSTAPPTGCCIPLGLHHILNSVPWFILGDYTNPPPARSCTATSAASSPATRPPAPS